MISKLIEKFNNLDGKNVSRQYLLDFTRELFDFLPESELIVTIWKKIHTILDTKADDYNVSLIEQYSELTEQQLLGLGVPFIVDDSHLSTGLNKAVSPNDIYNLITDKVLDLIDSSKNLVWHKPWTATGNFGEKATNLKTKTVYRGINDFLLNVVAPAERGAAFKNPFFLSFKQITELNGILKKGSKGYVVVYFTKIYSLKQEKPELSIRTNNEKKFNAFVKKNASKINDTAITATFPILKYYKVFSLDDVTGIKTPKVEIAQKDFKDIQIAEAIVLNMPNKPKLYLESKGDNAFYRGGSSDSVTMPKKSFFDSEQFYYSVFFHELIHATGAPKRLNRDMTGKFGSSNYAFEELIAEFGACFLCAESGILYKTINNSASYIKSWKKSVVSNAKKDNKFIFRAVSKSQAAADYILDRNKSDEPKYLVSLKEKQSNIRNKKEDITKNNSKKKLDISKRNTKSSKKTLEELQNIKKKNLKAIEKVNTKKEFERLLEYFGFTIFSINVGYNSKLDFYRAYKLNFKNIFGITLTVDINKGKPIDGYYSIKSYDGKRIEETYDSYENLQHFYHYVFMDLLPIIDIPITEERSIKEKYSNTIFTKNQNAKNQLKLFGLNGQVIANTDAFKNMTRNELRDFALQYYNHHFKGKTSKIDFVEEFYFTTQGGRKLAKGGKIYAKKTAALLKLAQIIKNSTYNNWGSRKAKDKPDVLGYLNFKSKLLIDGKKHHVRISLVVKKNRTKQFKNLDVGKKKSSVSSQSISKNGLEVKETKLDNKSTKTKPNSKKDGLKGEIHKVVLEIPKQEPKEIVKIPEVIVKPEPSLGAVEQINTKPEKSNNLKVKKTDQEATKKVSRNKNNPFKSSAEKRREKKEPAVLYNLKNPDLKKFLGNLEIKPKHSLVVTLDSGEGGGKTHTCYQLAHAFAESGYKPIIWSLEEHVSSNLSVEKQEKYFTENTSQIISVESDETENSDQENYDRIIESVEYFDVILIDSLTKMLELNKKFLLDKDLRKAFNGKLFVLVVQRTSTGQMRGGSKTGFDGDVILKVNVDRDNFENNYVYNHKNRYNNYTPISDLKYSPFHQKLRDVVVETTEPHKVILTV